MRSRRMLAALITTAILLSGSAMAVWLGFQANITGSTTGGTRTQYSCSLGVLPAGSSHVCDFSLSNNKAMSLTINDNTKSSNPECTWNGNDLAFECYYNSASSVSCTGYTIPQGDGANIFHIKITANAKICPSDLINITATAAEI